MSQDINLLNIMRRTFADMDRIIICSDEKTKISIANDLENFKVEYQYVNKRYSGHFEFGTDQYFEAEFLCVDYLLGILNKGENRLIDYLEFCNCSESDKVAEYKSYRYRLDTKRKSLNAAKLAGNHRTIEEQQLVNAIFA